MLKRYIKINTLLNKISRILRYPIYSHSIVIIWENRLKCDIIQPKINNIGLCTIDNITDFDNLFGKNDIASWYPLKINKFHERLSNGGVLFCATLNKTIVHMSWVGINKGFRDKVYHFPVNYAYESDIGGTVTNPEFRGKGIYTYVYSEIMRYLGKKNKQRALLETSINDIIIKNTQQKLGSGIVGYGHYLRIFYVFQYRYFNKVALSQNDWVRIR